MNRYKFRGKFIDTGEWVYGYLIGNDVIVGEIVEFNDEYFNCEFWYKVDPLSVEEFKCVECKKTLSEKNEYHSKWLACNADCYGKYVGEYAF